MRADVCSEGVQCGLMCAMRVRNKGVMRADVCNKGAMRADVCNEGAMRADVCNEGAH